MIKKRGRFHEFGKNPLKTYRRTKTDYQVAVLAECSRQTRLNNPTPAELRFAEELIKSGIGFTREKIIYNGDRWCLLDFYFPELKLAVEVDGSSHQRQKEYDAGRTDFLNRKGIKVIRFTNKEVMKNPSECVRMIHE